MEMKLINRVFTLINQFKIDLIVWKLIGESISIGPSEKFKIDLIVWKYCDESTRKILEKKV